MKKRLLFALLLVFTFCSSPKKYTPDQYRNILEQDDVLPQIISYIYSAPPYTAMKDRFKPEHRNFYSSLTADFSIVQYFIDEDGNHYFYLIRPAGKIGDMRGVAGHFKINEDKKITGFREVYVTPVLPEADLKNRCLFLFDEMIHGTLSEYLKMPDYVQWPNPASEYDTVTYEWRFKPSVVN